MPTFHKSNDLTTISLSKLKIFTVENSKELINAIGKVIDKKLTSSCSVISIIHDVEIKAIIRNTTSKMHLENLEKPGNTLIYKDEPKELQMFSYEQLKKKSKLISGIYQGKLYGTIELYSCDKKINCPDCEGSGICNNCNGDKQVTCTVCAGDLRCVSCDGTGRYTCTNCDGNGDCTDCDGGWVTCGYCYGDGHVSCSDCNGSGNYIDEFCRDCGGSGFYYNKTCRTCGGSGRFIKKCRRCGGNGRIECDNCDGDGGWNCEECHGTGKCSHCHGKGGFICKSCGGSGSCGKCKGKGKIWCPDCHGKGKCFNCKGDKLITCPRCNGLGEFQSYTQYSMLESHSVRDLCSIPIEKNYISSINGDSCYNGVVYEFFAKKASAYNLEDIEKSVPTEHLTTIKKWFALEVNSTFSSDKVNDDYLYTSAEVFKIPVTKVVLKCNSTEYKIWIVGNNKTIFYDNLPSLMARFCGRIGKLFG